MTPHAPHSAVHAAGVALLGAQTGVAYIGLTLTTIVFSVLAQSLVTRIGIRTVLPLGLALSTVALVWC